MLVLLKEMRDQFITLFFFFRIRSIYNLKQLFLRTLFEWTNSSIFTSDSLADLIDCYYFYAL